MDQQNHSSSSSRTDRKTIEKNRRNQMKALYSQLHSLVPHQQTKEATSLPDQLDEAATYIKKLQVSLERMKEKKNSLMGYEKGGNDSGSGDGTGKRRSQSSGTKSRVEIHEMGSSSALEVVLTTGLDGQFLFNETIRVLHEEGADVVNASFSVVNAETVLHTIHCENIGGFIPSPESSRISVRLNKLVDEANMGF